MSTGYIIVRRKHVINLFTPKWLFTALLAIEVPFVTRALLLHNVILAILFRLNSAQLRIKYFN